MKSLWIGRNEDGIEKKFYVDAHYEIAVERRHAREIAGRMFVGPVSVRPA